MIFLEVPLCILASFPGNYWGYIAWRVLGGLFFPALYQQPFILALELMPPATRTYTGKRPLSEYLKNILSIPIARFGIIGVIRV